MTVWFCYPMEMPPQGSALTLVQATRLRRGSSQGWDPQPWVLLWRHRGGVTDPRPSWCEWGSGGGEKRVLGWCWVCLSSTPS